MSVKKKPKYTEHFYSRKHPSYGLKAGNVESMMHKGGSVRNAESGDKRTKTGPEHKHPCPLSNEESFDSQLVEVGNSYQNHMVYKLLLICIFYFSDSLFLSFYYLD